MRHSNWPKQILQFEEVASLLLPVLDTDVSVQIARTMQQHERQCPRQRGEQIRHGGDVHDHDIARDPNRRIGRIRPPRGDVVR